MDWLNSALDWLRLNINWLGMSLIAGYFVIVNIVAFFAYRRDKHLARRRSKHRIPESRLLVYALIGGAFGAMLAMQRYHHKTKNKLFRILVPAFLFFHVLLGVGLFVSKGVQQNAQANGEISFVDDSYVDDLYKVEE